ncbi:MAG TPA: DinB family protein [Methylomirabilota bacterium]|nr:DinB family protein [Methylomirabilota bacterium]
MTSSRCPICRSPHHRLGKTRPLAALRAAPGKLAAALRRAPRRLVGRRPARGEWAITEVLCHLADAEVALGFRVRKLAAEPGAAIPAWDQERWADEGHYRRTPAAEALRTFTGLRRANLAYAGRLRRSQWRHHGRHPEYGRITIAQLFAHWAEHDLNHLEQMRKTLAALASKK